MKAPFLVDVEETATCCACGCEDDDNNVHDACGGSEVELDDGREEEEEGDGGVGDDDDEVDKRLFLLGRSLVSSDVDDDVMVEVRSYSLQFVRFR